MKYRELILFDNTKGYHQLIIQVWYNKSVDEISKELTKLGWFDQKNINLSLEIKL